MCGRVYSPLSFALLIFCQHVIMELLENCLSFVKINFLYLLGASEFIEYEVLDFNYQYVILNLFQNLNSMLNSYNLCFRDSEQLKKLRIACFLELSE